PAEPFSTRYGVLQAMRQFKDAGRQLPEDQVFQMLLNKGLKQDDISDLFIDSIRRWSMWNYTAKILLLYKPDSPAIMKRSIVRFALQSPEQRAKEFIVKMRVSHPELVENA